MKSPLSFLLAFSFLVLPAGQAAAGFSMDELEFSIQASGESKPKQPVPLQKQARKLKASVTAPKELFKVGKVGDNITLEIREYQFNKDYLFSGTLDKGTGEKGLFSSQMADTFIWFFQRNDQDTVLFVRKNMENRAKPGTPEDRALKHSYPDSPVVALPVISSGTTQGSVIVPAVELFMNDIIGLGERLARLYPDNRGGPRLSLEKSSFEGVVAYPRNAEARARLVFERLSDKGSSLPDGRTIPITMHYSLSMLPDSPDFEPREADERVGYFTDDYKDFSREDLKDTNDPTVSLINRWNLEKTDPNLELSPVKKPITVWLEDKIPFEHRPSIKAGILAWNKAFEAAGFKDAIVVKEVDKDMPEAERKLFDPANAAYNTVRWFMGENAGFAQGPSRSNPLTGEIFNFSIRVSESMTRLSSGEFDLAGLRSKTGGEDDYLDAAALNASRNLALLKAKGSLSAAEEKRYREEYLQHIIAHEVGHVLGLRHNFKGSEMLSQDELGKDGLLASTFMDYLPAHIPRKGEAPAPFFQTDPGPYDYWAIEYGYKPLLRSDNEKKDKLKAIADRSATDPKLAYGTDEDTGGSDPNTQRFDLGKETLPFARERTALALELWKSLETKEPSPKKGYASLRDIYTTGLGQYIMAVDSVYPIIGGVKSYRDRPGTQHTPFEPVSAEEQREALKFLDQAVFAAEPFKIDPALLSKLVNERRGGYTSASPFPIVNYVEFIQKRALGNVLNSGTLSSIQNNSLMSKEPETAITVSEVMGSVRKSVWKELDESSAAGIHLYRRNLQRAHIEALNGLLTDPYASGDAKALARVELKEIEKKIADGLKRRNNKFAGTDKAHLMDLLDTIKNRLYGKPETTG